MQGAYGIVAEVESHPFELDTMLFMDWRDDHTSGSLEEKNRLVSTHPVFTAVASNY